MTDEGMSIHEAVTEFRRQATSLVAVSDRARLKRLYSRFVVYARARHTDCELEVVAVMEDALREALLAPSSKARWGRFDNLANPDCGSLRKGV